MTLDNLELQPSIFSTSIQKFLSRNHNFLQNEPTILPESFQPHPRPPTPPYRRNRRQQFCSGDPRPPPPTTYHHRRHHTPCFHLPFFPNIPFILQFFHLTEAHKTYPFITIYTSLNSLNS